MNTRSRQGKQEERGAETREEEEGAHVERSHAPGTPRELWEEISDTNDEVLDAQRPRMTTEDEDAMFEGEIESPIDAKRRRKEDAERKDERQDQAQGALRGEAENEEERREREGDDEEDEERGEEQPATMAVPNVKSPTMRERRT